MKVLVIGRTGQIATELLERLPRAGHDAVGLEPPELDITDPASVAAAMAAHAPDAVINAAAYTAVDKAEDDEATAFAVNATGPRLLGEATAARRIPIIHYSTDYVFAGTKDAPYAEDDATGPTGAYGRSKLAGEVALHAAHPRAVTLRTAWVCSPHGHNFLKTMLRLAETREEVAVVADQHGAPTFADDLADAAIALLPRMSHGPFGVFHLSGAPHTTWHGFAAAIFEAAGRRGLKVPRLKPIATADYPTRATRPPNSRLDCARIAAAHGIGAADWRAGLERALDRLLPR